MHNLEEIRPLAGNIKLYVAECQHEIVPSAVVYETELVGHKRKWQKPKRGLSIPF